MDACALSFTLTGELACRPFPERNRITSSVVRQVFVRRLEDQQWDEADRLASNHLDEALFSLPADVLLRHLQAAPRSHLELLTLQALLLERMGQPIPAQEAYHAALDLSLRRDLRNRAGDIYERLCQLYIQHGDDYRLREVSQQGLRFSPLDNPAQQSVFLAWSGASLVNNGEDFERGYSWLRKAHYLATHAASPKGLAKVNQLYGFAYHFPQGNFAQAQRFLREGWECLGSGSEMRAQLLLNQAVVALVECDHASVRNYLARGREDEFNNVFFQRGLDLVAASLAADLGTMDECESILNGISREWVPAHLKGWFFRTRLLCHLAKGRWQALEVEADEMMRSLNFNGYGIYGPGCLCALAYVRLAAGQAESAHRLLQECLSLCQRSKAKFWTMIAKLLLGEKSEARRICLENDYERYWQCDPWNLTGMAQKRANKIQLKIYTLGRLEFRHGDCMLDPRLSPRAGRLLSYLLAHAHQAVPIDRLLDDLWPALEPRAAKNTLWVQTSALRKALSCPDLIVRRGDLVGLNLDSVWLDCIEFEKLAGARKNFPALQRADELYRGSFLPPQVYEDWIDGRRRHLEMLYHEVAEAIGDMLVERGEFDRAAVYFRRSLNSEWPQEGRFLKLCKCHAMMQDRSSLWRDFQEYRNRLEDLGGPSPRVYCVVREILGLPEATFE